MDRNSHRNGALTSIITGSYPTKTLLELRAKYRLKAGIVLAVFLVLPVAALYALWVSGPWVSDDTDAWLLANIGQPAAKWLEGSVPGAVAVVSALVGADNLRWPITPLGLAKLMVMGLGFYLFSFVAYVVMRRGVRRWDLKDYRRLTGGQAPSTHW